MKPKKINLKNDLWTLIASEIQDADVIDAIAKKVNRRTIKHAKDYADFCFMNSVAPHKHSYKDFINGNSH